MTVAQVASSIPCAQIPCTCYKEVTGIIMSINIINCRIHTFGSNFNEEAVKKAALPSFNAIAKPPTRGEYSIAIM